MCVVVVGSFLFVLVFRLVLDSRVVSRLGLVVPVETVREPDGHGVVGEVQFPNQTRHRVSGAPLVILDPLDLVPALTRS